MKVSQYILNFISSLGVDTIFGITGGAITPTFDAFHGRSDIRYICMQHEQACAMAADAYSRVTDNIGVCMSTSGPGATNLITGLACSWFDSIPVLAITGNVNTHESREGTRSVARQVGFQETDIVNIAHPITKYAHQVMSPNSVPCALEYAVYIAKSGRPGPVLVDIPMNVQRAEIDPYDCDHFTPPISSNGKPIDEEVRKTLELLSQAKRPVLIVGAGIRHAKAVPAFREFVEQTQVPVCPSWAAIDILPHDRPRFVSTFGVYGHRAGNYAVQNADLIIAIGTRLDTRMTGGKPEMFAPKAIKIVCDIDAAELHKRLPVDVPVCADAERFLRALNAALPQYPMRADIVPWLMRIKDWKRRYPILDFAKSEGGKIHPLNFVDALSDALPDNAIIILDSGANLSWAMQALKVKGTQRVFSAFGFSPMGYALPAAIGAAAATDRPVVAINGDGSMQVNIQELQTLKHYNLPVKLFILNNGLYGIIQQFQDELFEGRYIASGKEGGYSVPDFVAIAKAYGLNRGYLCHDVFSFALGDYFVRSEGNWSQEIPAIIQDNHPFICDVQIDPSARILPKVQFGHALDDQSPYLPKDEHDANMEV